MLPLIEAHGITRHYGKRCVVNNISFTLEKGQILGFLGPNGAGKTTTMQMLTGNLAPDSGQVHINGFCMQKQPTRAKDYLGYLPEIPPLYKDLSVREFLVYCAKLHRVNKSELSGTVDEVLSRCGLTSVANRLIGYLSKGYQQRVGIAQAIVHKPDLIILDEPTVGLDPIQIKEIRNLIKELGREHGIILSTHILSEVQEACTHVLIIHQGQTRLNESLATINARAVSGTLQVTTQHPVEIAKLLAIPNVDGIETLSETQIAIHHPLQSNPSQQIMETIMNEGWQLEALVPLKKSLEDIFIDLTKDETL